MTPNGAAIRAFREVRGYSVRHLAHLAGRHASSILRIEEETRGASQDTIELIAAALEVPIDAVIREKL